LRHLLNRIPQILEIGVVILLLFMSDAILPFVVDTPLKPILNIIIYILVVILLGLFFCKPRITGLFYALTRDKVLLLLIGLAIASIVWSTNPGLTWDYGKTLVRSLLFGAYLSARFSVRDQMYLVAAALSLAICASLISSFIPPTYGMQYINDEYAFRGIYAHKQYLARAMTAASISFILIGLVKPRLRLLIWFFSVLAVFLTFLSTGRSAIVTLVVCMSLLPFYGLLKQDYRIRTAILIVTGLVISIGTIFLATNLQTFVVDILGKSTDFNGRTPLWISVLEKGFERPWFGYGYYGFWSTPEAYSAINEPWTFDALRRGMLHAHSIFVDIFLQLGIVGLVVFALSYITLIVRLIRLLMQSPKIEFFWMLQITIMGLILQSTEVPVTLAFNVFLWILYISTCCSSVLELERLQRVQATVISKPFTTSSIQISRQRHRSTST
jgi:exopolysaccharide production protein ExoQ